MAFGVSEVKCAIDWSFSCMKWENQNIVIGVATDTKIGSNFVEIKVKDK